MSFSTMNTQISIPQRSKYLNSQICVQDDCFLHCCNIKILIVMSFRDHVTHIARISRRKRSIRHEKDRLHSEEFGDSLLAYVRTYF